MEHDLHDLYLQILRCALLNIRLMGEKGRAKDCAVEADHVHNIPELLVTGNPGMEKYYWEVERKIYVERADRLLASVFSPIWDQIKEEKGAS